LGAPAITTRGLKEGDMDTIADLIDRVVTNIDSDVHIKAVGEEVVKMMQDRPLFTWE
jgi:glycine hydroxymethyltransferase